MRFLVFLALTACAATTPSHLPNPALRPFLAIENGLSNAAYNARRSRVSRFVNANFGAIKQELSAETPPLLTQAMALAKIPEANHQALLSELRQHPEIYLTEKPEPLIVALMVHGP